jgi:glycosyltransferase involved in cell wall biosynthesis
MRILHINNFHYIRGGSDVVYFETAQVFEEAGHSCVLFAGAHHNNLSNKYQSYFPASVDTGRAGISQFGSFLYNPIARTNLQQLIADHGPFDVAHLHIYHGRLTPSILEPLREAKIPIVQTLHEYKLACPVYTMERSGQTCDACILGSKLNILRHRCKNGSLLHSAAVLAEFWSSRLQGDVSHIDRFICISDFQLEVMRRAGLPKTKLQRIYNFVDTERITPIPIVNKENFLLYFGRIEKLKGVPTLIETVKKTGHQLKIVGAGNWLDEMKKSISNSPNIEYLGFASGDELHGLISKARAVVVPSEWYEPFGLTIIEAKAAGTPVVGANIGGIPELIREGIDGFLFQPGDKVSLAAALKRLGLSNLNQLSKAAREDVSARFSPASHLQELLEVYQEL